MPSISIGVTDAPTYVCSFPNSGEEGLQHAELAVLKQGIVFQHKTRVRCACRTGGPDAPRACAATFGQLIRSEGIDRAFDAKTERSRAERARRIRTGEIREASPGHSPLPPGRLRGTEVEL